jgi:competence protein ComEA
MTEKHRARTDCAGLWRRLALAALAAVAIVTSIGVPAAAYAAAAAGSEAAAQVDINTASVEELMTVPGIGQVIAQRIVEFRDKNGPYKSIDDLLKVQGIGEKSLARIREHLSVGRPRK